MEERFSAKYEDFYAAIKTELLSVELREDDLCLVQYVEMPWLPGDRFSVAFIENQKKKSCHVVIKYWDHEHDMNRFSSGIYNLDRLCI